MNEQEMIDISEISNTNANVNVNNLINNSQIVDMNNYNSENVSNDVNKNINLNNIGLPKKNKNVLIIILVLILILSVIASVILIKGKLDDDAGIKDYNLSPKEAIEYEKKYFGGAFISVEGNEALVSNNLYYSNRDYDGNLLDKALYSMDSYVSYIKWLDKEIYKDKKFREEYSESLINKGSYSYFNTGKLIKSSYDFNKSTSKYEFTIEKVESVETDIRIHVKVTKGSIFNLYELSKKDEILFYSLINNIIDDYTDIPLVKIGSVAYSDTKFDFPLESQVSTFAYLSGNNTKNSSEFTIRLYRNLEEGKYKPNS